MLEGIRAFFIQRNVLEVETPALSLGANTDPFISSFSCINNESLRYLHTSPEYPMKRLLAAGSGDIYQICKVWRENEVGKNHNPEFTILEWYRVGFSYHQLMQEVAALLHNLVPGLKKQPKIYTYEQLFLEKFSINPHITKRQALATCVTENVSSLSTDNLDHQALLDALLTHCIEPDFEKDCLTFVYDYPVSQSALAQIKQQGDYAVAERFEVYLGAATGTKELGNGYQEETNYERNKQILSTENNTRKNKELDMMPEDKHFLQACNAGIPASAGIAIGLDRVLMCITGEKSIQKVINFSWDKA
jgi:lysyl-tRNA synthetase class 2